MKQIKEDWACSIIAQALSDIKTKKDVKCVVEKVGRTAIGVRSDLMKQFLSLVKMKEQTLS